MLALNQDHHVHSTFSDGRGTLLENIRAAEEAGLTTLGCVDHVRRDTSWTPSFAAAVARAQALTEVWLVCGVETKILDVEGRLDVPDHLGNVERVYIADHQVPWHDGPTAPWRMRRRLEDGSVSTEAFLRTLIGATASAVRRAQRCAVVAHLFSILPKVGLSEAQVDPAWLAPLIDAVLDTGTLVELDERWESPGLSTVRVLREAGVKLVASSDAHEPNAIGQYTWLRTVAEGLVVAA